MISFLCGGARIDLEDVDPNTTVLEWLRGSGRVGTKEGCASGDCGACTVVTVHATDAGTPAGDTTGADDGAADGDADGDAAPIGDGTPPGLEYRTVNACISLLGSLDATQLITVEDLADPATGELHPVQQAMVDEHGSQCGFCTPGFVMSMFAWAHRDPSPDRHAIDTALAGNLCRCTGYRPIIAAARAVAHDQPIDHFDRAAGDTAVALAALAAPNRAGKGEPPRLASNGRTWIAPRTLDEAVALLADQPDAIIVTGGTDLVLEITQGDRRFDHLVDLSRVAELHATTVAGGLLTIGAAVPMTEAGALLASHFPATAELWDRYGSPPVRNRATLGGNLGTASPIGDSPPVLLALGATVVLAGARGQRRVAADGFFLGYRETALAHGEVIAAVEVPLAGPDEHLSVSKVSKRLDDDISAVCGAFNLTVVDATITAARVAFGGMAAVPARARACEAALTGQPVDDTTLAAARAALADDFSPIDDMRATAGYRTTVAANLLTRAFLEVGGQDTTRVTAMGRT